MTPREQLFAAMAAAVIGYLARTAQEKRRQRAQRAKDAAFTPMAQRREAVVALAFKDDPSCGVCGERPDMLQIIELYDGADLFCSSCARLFVGPLKEAA